MKTYNEEEPNEEGTKIISIEKSTPEIFSQGNKIYFYTEVTRETVLNLNKQIDDLTKQMKIIQFTYNFSLPPQIEIHICSDGGDVFASLASIDKISNSDVSIHTFCEGVVSSAASLISVCGHKRFITKNSCMLLHSVSSQFWGNYIDLKQEVKNMDLIMSIIKNIYLKKTKFKSKELGELLKHDLYLNSSKCLKMGLVDSIL